jgi:von Willebrand factor type A domain
LPETPANAIRVCPFVIVVDCSESMDGAPIAAVNQQLPAMISEINGYPPVAELARLGMISFNHAAKVEFPISDPQDLVAPPLTARSITDYGAALDAVREVLLRDIPRLGESHIQRPIVLFMTDGMPSDSSGQPLSGQGHERWLTAWRRLQDPFPFRPNIACLGFGDAAREPLLMLANHDERLVKLVQDRDPVAAIREIFQLILTTVITVTGGGGTGGDDFFEGLVAGGDADLIAVRA